MRTTEKCPVCQRDLSPLASRQGENYAYLRCTWCGCDKIWLDQCDVTEWFLVQQNKYYSSQPIHSISPLGSELENDELNFRINKINRLLSSHQKICEVGPGSGRFACEMLNLGHDVTVVEQAEITISLKQILGNATIINSEFEKLKKFEEKFDAVCSFHVIEHVPDAIAHLEKALSITKRGGFLILATPNTNSIQHRLPFSLSPHFDSAHLLLFSQKSLVAALEKTGWEVIEITTNEYLVYWMRVFTKILRRSKKDSYSIKAGDFVNNSGFLLLNFYKILRFIFHPFLSLQARMRLGSELFVVAQKK